MDLTRSFTAEQFARALESWDWAGVQGKQPLFTSPFGDVFFQAQDGFWFLDLLEGKLTRPWPGADELRAELDTAEGQDRYLMAGLAFAAERQGIIPSASQVLSFRLAAAGASFRARMPASAAAAVTAPVIACRRTPYGGGCDTQRSARPPQPAPAGLA